MTTRPRGHTTRLVKQLERELRKEGKDIRDVLWANSVWQFTPEIKELIKALHDIQYVLVPQIQTAFEIGKASPEAQAFIIRLMQQAGHSLLEASQYEDRHENGV